ncbi:MAG: zf-TFIIB domain-containing protein [Verrucomicrobiota bacterium]|jgi:uncharacterized protein
MLKCPRCHSVLCTIDYEAVEIETCPDCRGEWLDADELAQIVRKVEQTFSQEELADLDSVHRNVFRVEKTEGAAILCPRCPDHELTPFNFASSSGIVLDKCPQCQGVWLDAAELEKVQALVEEWNAHLGKDLARFGSVIEKTRRASEQSINHAAAISRFNLVNVVLRHVVHIMD